VIAVRMRYHDMRRAGGGNLGDGGKVRLDTHTGIDQ
jgi:hypothetical protein